MTGVAAPRQGASDGPGGAGDRAPEGGARPLRVCVVVCAFTQARWVQLQRAVDSLHAQTRPVQQVLVVIDHDEPLYERAQAELPARVVRNAEAQGLSGARNTGVGLVDADVVAFLDDDAYAEPDWLRRLLEPYQERDVLAVGGGVVAAFDSARPAFLPPEFDWVVGCSYTGLPTARAQVRNLIGANMSFRREVFERVGGFQHSLGRVGDRPLGCEETELCIRASRAWPGGLVVLEPAARVHHQVPDSRATWAYFRARCYAEGQSKAAVARLTGATAGLASERRYVTRVLPAGVAGAVAEALLRGRPGALARAAAVVVGLALTTAGYLGSARGVRRAAPGVDAAQPAPARRTADRLVA